MKKKKFIIPDYQRPYKWDFEKCETLWNDVINFYTERKATDEYFLGTIVTCKVENTNESDIEIIDGQQRITSFFLLLRAFYFKLEKMTADDNINGLKRQIEPCIWDVDEISLKVKDRKQIHIHSKVATESDNDTFHAIIEEGITNTGDKDLYSLNYQFFLKKCEEYARDNPTHWQPLCVMILEKCIVLPIDCENVDTALTIFSTLNDRGMPLSDSDIFKAQIYRRKKSDEEKQNFTVKWKELTEIAEDASISLNELFRFYTHKLRAENKDKSKEIGLRKFYGLNNYNRLEENSLMENLAILVDFWFTVNSKESKFKDEEKINLESKKYLHCLEHYPNEFWKYITTVYVFKNVDKSDFIETFPVFLKNITAFLYAKFIEKPTVNAIKDDIYQGCIDIFNENFKFSMQLGESFKQQLSNATNFKVAKGLILLHAYLNPNQKNLIPEKFEIEHIFPRNWQDTNYNGWERKDADIYLEKFGNKVAIEKKVNIRAGNNYFGKKKTKYKDSDISNIIILSNYPSNDWLKDDIEKRELTFIDDLYSFFETHLSL